jgi:hypothetical protein
MQHSARWEHVALNVARSTSRAARLAVRQGFVLTTVQARNAGMDPAHLRRLIRGGVWSRPRRGVLSVLPPAGDLSGGSLEISATAAALARPGSVISAESAAILHGLSVLTPPTRPVLSGGGSHAGGRDLVLLRPSAVPERDRRSWYGTALTAIPRTVFDIACNSGTAAGLVVADAALAESLCSRSELQALCAQAFHWPGVEAARRVCELASDRSESPLESITRLCLAEGGLPPAELQAWIDTANRRYRVDMLWRSHRVVVEADGAVKYRDDSALWREKRRQEDLEQAGYRVVRVTWADVLHEPRQTVARVRWALGASTSGSF